MRSQGPPALPSFVHTHTHTHPATHTRAQQLLNAGESLAGSSTPSPAHTPPHTEVLLASHLHTQRSQNPHTNVHTLSTHRYARGGTQALRWQTGMEAQAARTHHVGGHRCLPPARPPCLQGSELPGNPCPEGTRYRRMVKCPTVRFQIQFSSISAPQSWFLFSRGMLNSAT